MIRAQHSLLAAFIVFGLNAYDTGRIAARSCLPKLVLTGLIREERVSLARECLRQLLKATDGTPLLQSNLAAPQNTEPATHFAKAKQLIEDNCADCMGATREGLELGIGEVLKAIDRGYKDRVAAYKLLARAYNTQTIHVDNDSQEYKTLLDKIRPVYEKLSKLAPRDPEIPYEYAIYMKDEEDQLAAYRKALIIDPHYASARFVIGRIFINKGELEAGIKEMKRAVRDANEIDAEDYGQELIGILKVNNRWQEAEAIRTLVEARIKRAENIDRRKKKRE